MISPTDTGPGAQGAGSEQNFCRVMVVRGAHFGDQFLVPKKVPVFGPRFWAPIKNIWEDQKKGPKNETIFGTQKWSPFWPVLVEKIG